MARCSFSACLLLSATLALAEEHIREVSTSPDKRFTVLHVYVDDDENSPFFRIVERKTKRAVARVPKEGQAGFSEEARFVWAPGSRRLAYNYREGGRYETASLYQWKKNAFVEVRSPEVGSAAIEQDRQKQIKELGLAKDVYRRRIWDTWRIRAWPDADTALLFVHSIRTVPVPNGTDKPDIVEIESAFRFTLKFDESGAWKIAKSHRLSDAELEKETAE